MSGQVRSSCLLKRIENNLEIIRILITLKITGFFNKYYQVMDLIKNKLLFVCKLISQTSLSTSYPRARNEYGLEFYISYFFHLKKFGSSPPSLSLGISHCTIDVPYQKNYGCSIAVYRDIWRKLMMDHPPPFRSIFTPRMYRSVIVREFIHITRRLSFLFRAKLRAPTRHYLLYTIRLPFIHRPENPHQASCSVRHK